MEKLLIYTDGACSGNPGPGGYGILMRLPQRNYQKTFAAGYRKTTNNRMELMAVIVALQQIRQGGFDIHIYTDSKYVSEAINQKWLFNWARRNFQKIKNPDLWKLYYPLHQQYTPTFHWLKGHNGHPENEICDQLAVAASKAKQLLCDTGFEDNAPPASGTLWEG